MAIRISDALGISSEMLNNEGAFDGFVDIDSQLHIDPYLLRNATTVELKDSYGRFQEYFNNIIKLLDNSNKSNDRLFREAVQGLIFHEIPFAALGYSKTDKGKGIGLTLARNLAQTASEIINAGVKDSVIFEIVGLLEDGVGPDKISDMTIRIILQDILNFSARAARNLNVRTIDIAFNKTSYKIPCYKGRPKLLFPREILRDLPVAYDWSDVDYVCAYNDALRRSVNKIIGDTWKHATQKISKEDLRNTLIDKPDVLRDLIKQYRDKKAEPYDFINDPAGEISWYTIAKQFSSDYPLRLVLGASPSIKDIEKVIIDICKHFRDLIENRGLWKSLYNVGKLLPEPYAQRIFYGIADSYCKANNIDLNPETNAGPGPVDFKFSSGYALRALVEVKYSSNSHLIKGYTKQLPTYTKAQNSQYNLYLVIQTNKTDVIDKLIKVRNEEIKSGNKPSDILVVDGQKKKSASKK